MPKKVSKRYNVSFTNGKQYKSVTLYRIKKLFSTPNQRSAIVTNAGDTLTMTVNVINTLSMIVISQDSETSNNVLATYDKATKEAQIFNQSPDQLLLTTAILEAQNTFSAILKKNRSTAILEAHINQ